MNSSDQIRLEFVGDVVRHTKGGEVYCDAQPEFGKVTFDGHDCQTKMTAGDEVVVRYIRKEVEDEWLQKYRFCRSCEGAKVLRPVQRREGVEQAVVSGRLEGFEGVVSGEVYDDAVRLIDVELLAYSPPSEGKGTTP